MLGPELPDRPPEELGQASGLDRFDVWDRTLHAPESKEADAAFVSIRGWRRYRYEQSGLQDVGRAGGLSGALRPQAKAIGAKTRQSRGDEEQLGAQFALSGPDSLHEAL
jgi:hypothetical protein